MSHSLLAVGAVGLLFDSFLVIVIVCLSRGKLFLIEWLSFETDINLQSD